MASSLCHFLCFLLLLLPLSAQAQTSGNISLNTSLSTSGNSSWVSPSGDFAFGFIRMQDSNLFLLAIWFHKIPERTIIWSANGDKLVQGGSKVELTSDGRLVLNDHRGQEIWKAEPTSGDVTYAALLDTGNLVLGNSNSDRVWQSFEQPTNTLLPTQTLDQGAKLSSHETENNYSTGRFQLVLDTDGDLGLWTANYLTQFRYKTYWNSKTEGTDSQLIFNQSGYIYLQATNGSIYNLTAGSVAPTRNFYHRATLDFDGVFRQYTLPKNPGSRSWSIIWSVPSDICLAIVDDDGSGACGFNSYCQLENQRPSCYCPQNYSYIDPKNKFKGCKPDFVWQNCESEPSQEEPQRQFDLIEMPNTDWPMSDFEHYNPLNEEQCREACLADCFCAVAIFRNADCWKKKLPLSNGRLDASVGGKAFLKVPRGNSTSPKGLVPPGSIPSRPVREKKDQGPQILILSTLLGSSAFLNLLFLSAVLFVVYFSNRKKLLKSQTDSVTLGLYLRSFTYKELEEVTDGFKEELGSGAFSTVYKGVLASKTGNFVAVKRLDKVEKECDKEFKTELSAISRTQHKNLVKLLGFCDEGSHRLLVYEFMRNGSLAQFLFGSSRPSWNQRIQIASGIARGLLYLHEECGTQIIHCDIKPQNILLDDSFTARISDFGLAKLLHANQTRTSTGIRGTKGYVAPEWFRNVAITAKVDVYSFGALLLEIICCRKNVELGDEGIPILTDWAYDCFQGSRLDMLVDNDEEALDDARRLERMVIIAIWCVQEEPSLRPSMRKVTQMLEGAVEVSVPPGPSSFISSIN